MLKRLIGAAVALPLLCGCGCLEYVGLHKPTYRTVRVCDDTCPFPGVPTLVYTPHQVIVTWQKTENDGSTSARTTQHLAKLPVMYGVDIHQAGLGRTAAKFKFNDDGSMVEADGEVDHQIDEILASAADLTEAASLGGARALGDIAFFPPLPEDAGDPVDIQIVEIGN